MRCSPEGEVRIVAGALLLTSMGFRCRCSSGAAFASSATLLTQTVPKKAAGCTSASQNSAVANVTGGAIDMLQRARRLSPPLRQGWRRKKCDDVTVSLCRTFRATPLPGLSGYDRTGEMGFSHPGKPTYNEKFFTRHWNGGRRLSSPTRK